MPLSDEPETAAIVYPCAVDKNDSLSIAERFDDGDLEIMTYQGGKKWPVYMSVESVQQIYAQLGDALHAHFEGPNG